MEQRDFYLHLGFPKTATTAFQRSIFSTDSQIAYLGKRSQSKTANSVAEKIFANLLWSSGKYWIDHGDLTRKNILEATEELPHRTGGSVLVSEETLLGGCLGMFRVVSRWREGRFVGLDLDTLAERLHLFSRHAWPEGRVRALITLRRQDHLLASLFAQTFLWRRAGGCNSLEQLAEQIIDQDYYSMGGLALDYNGLIERFEQALGPESVKIIFFEDINNDLSQVVRTLQDSVGIDPHLVQQALSKPKYKVRRVDEASWTVLRHTGTNRFKHLVETIGDFMNGRHTPSVAKLTPELSRFIMNRYRESNRLLEKRVGRDLSAYGYTSSS